MDTTTQTPVVRVTDDALAKVLELRSAEENGDELGLRVEVTGVHGADFAYDLSFEPLVEAVEGDAVSEQNGLSVWIPQGSVANLRGATLDLPSTPGQGGLVLRNPNRPDPLGIDPSIELSGSIEEKVRTLLDTQVNPALASHGGFAELVRVEEDRVFISMGGGCQGCAISAMTLRDGIQKAIQTSIPEVAEVVDTTDHDAGENPYFTEDPT